LDSWSGGWTPQPNISVVARSKPLKLIEFMQRYDRFFWAALRLVYGAGVSRQGA
jgi:hypothetical protein